MTAVQTETHANSKLIGPTGEPIIPQRIYERVGFQPHSREQVEYCLSDARFNIPTCGRRWGKSQAAGHRMTVRAFVPNSINWIVGPNYRLGEKEFRVVYSDFQKLGIIEHCKRSYSVKQGDMRIQTPWGSVVEVVSADRPDSLLGEGLSHVIMSEAATHTRNVWEQYIEPALSDLRGSADFPSTPRGYNWYNGLWHLGQTPNQNVYRSWQLPTWLNAVRYPGGRSNPEIQRIEKQSSKVFFEQEYAALFTSLTGQIYEEWNPSIHVKEHTYRPDWDNFLAFDYGFANPFVCLDIQVAPDDTVFVWREYYLSGMSTHEHGLYLRDRENPPGYNVAGRWGDARGANEAATLAPLIGWVDSDAVIPWKHGVEEIKRLLKAERLFISPNCPNLIRQMSQLHTKQVMGNDEKKVINEQIGDGNIQHKVDDHATDALRYFIGPYFVKGANSRLSDLYGGNFVGSEAHEFLTLHGNVFLDDPLTSTQLF